jgi:hypothetical protein
MTAPSPSSTDSITGSEGRPRRFDFGDEFGQPFLELATLHTAEVAAMENHSNYAVTIHPPDDKEFQIFTHRLPLA